MQTNISIQSRRPAQSKSATRNRFSTISSQRREFEDRISVRSRFSTQNDPSRRKTLRFEPRASAVTDGCGLSFVENRNKDDARRLSPKKDDAQRQSPSIGSPDNTPRHDDDLAIPGHEVQDTRRRRAEIDQNPSQEVAEPLESTESQEIMLRSTGKPKVSMGWTFSDGFLLRTRDEFESTAGSEMRLREKSLAENPVTAPTIPIRWTFHDGFIFKTTEALKNDDDIATARSKPVLPMSWSFYDGFTFRSDGPVANISKVAGERGDVVRDGSKPKGMISLGWSFHDGLIIKPGDSVKIVSTTTGESGTIQASNSKRIIPISWNFHDGFIIRPGDSTKIISTTPGESEKPMQASNSNRVVPLSWSFHDGLTIRPGDSVKAASTAPRGESEETVQEKGFKTPNIQSAGHFMRV